MFDPASVRGWLKSRMGLVMLALLGALVGYTLFGTSWFYIYDVDVAGLQRLTREEIYNRSNLEALHLFWARPGAVAQRLEADPTITRASVAVLPPNWVRIHVQERVPVAVWQSGGNSYYVDNEGVLFALRGDATGMLVIRDLRDTPVEPGTTVEPEAIRTAQELTQVIPERRAFDWETGHGLSYLTEDGWRVIFGDYTRLATKVAAFRAFKEQIHPEQKILLLDLSVPEHPYYRVSP
jgi:cell division septal protein FtsQ